MRLNSATQTNRAYELETVGYSHPNCCTAINRDNGRQCMYKAEEGYSLCPKHNIGKKSKDLRNYRLGKVANRVNEFADNPNIKCLREEIGIVRMVLENIINLCNGEQDLLLNSAQIANMVEKIDKLVNSCNKLEIQTDQLLDRSKIVMLADGILNILNEELKDEEVITNIASRMGELLT